MKGAFMVVNLFLMQITKASWQQVYSLFVTGTIVLLMVFLILHLIFNIGGDPVYRIVLRICKGHGAKAIVVLIALPVLCVVISPILIVIVAIYICDLNIKIIHWCRHKSKRNYENDLLCGKLPLPGVLQRTRIIIGGPGHGRVRYYEKPLISVSASTNTVDCKSTAEMLLQEPLPHTGGLEHRPKYWLYRMLNVLGIGCSHQQDASSQHKE